MILSSHRTSLVASLVIAGLLLGACGGAEQTRGPKSVLGEDGVSAAGIQLPQQVLGLVVQPENVSEKLKEARRAYLDRLGLFSFRENDLVRATFQVARFNELADAKSPKFRSSIIGLLGTRKPDELRISGVAVYATTGTEQNLYAWFKGKGFFILSVHREYEFPRTLTRRLVELEHSL